MLGAVDEGLSLFEGTLDTLPVELPLAIGTLDTLLKQPGLAISAPSRDKTSADCEEANMTREEVGMAVGETKVLRGEDVDALVWDEEDWCEVAAAREQGATIRDEGIAVREGEPADCMESTVDRVSTVVRAVGPVDCDIGVMDRVCH